MGWDLGEVERERVVLAGWALAKWCTWPRGEGVGPALRRVSVEGLSAGP